MCVTVLQEAGHVLGMSSAVLTELSADACYKCSFQHPRFGDELLLQSNDQLRWARTRLLSASDGHHRCRRALQDARMNTKRKITTTVARMSIATISGFLLIGALCEAEFGPYTPVEFLAQRHLPPIWSRDGDTILVNGLGSIRNVRSDHSSLELSYVAKEDPASGEPALHFRSPDISPDGSLVVSTRPYEEADSSDLFTDWRPHEIVVTNIEGEIQYVLPHHRDTSVFPRWSPDGTRIAFLARDRIKGTVEQLNLYTVSADGSDPLLIGDGILRLAPEPPQWSPTGDFIAIRSLEGRLYIVAADGSYIRKVSDRLPSSIGTTPAWSFDGAHIGVAVYVREEQKTGVYVIGIEDRKIERVLTLDRLPLSMEWSPAGSELMFAIPNGLPVIWDDETNNYMPIDLERYFDDEPDDPPIVGGHLFVIDLEDSRLRIVNAGFDGDTASAAWSPDGNQLAVLTEGESSDMPLLYVVDSDGSNPRVLLRGSENRDYADRHYFRYVEIAPDGYLADVARRRWNIKTLDGRW